LEERNTLVCQKQHYPLIANTYAPYQDRNYILKELPEGYILWEHVKYKVEKLAEGKREKGKHAAGIYERQDAYLYGHPEGRRKRYRSPADFFPHLLWLAVDKEGDSRNCSCKMCSPDGEEDPQESTVKVEAVVKRENKVAPPVSAVPKGTLTQLGWYPANRFQLLPRSPRSHLHQWLPNHPSRNWIANPMGNTCTDLENWSGTTRALHGV
jgi:hypothetical protein